MIYYNKSYSCDTLDEAFEFWYKLLCTNRSKNSSRDGVISGEIINATTVINDPTKNIMTSNIRKLSLKYGIGEMLWYLACDNTLDGIRKYTKGWDRMSDDGYTVNSNYGWCITKKYDFNQLQFVIDELKNNPDSRRAVIHIKEPTNKDSKDVNCAVYLQFFIRDNKLYMISNMRSNDIWLGFPYDVFQFTCLQIYLSMILHVDLGSYTHNVGSLHLYERNVINEKEF